jgi:hypothetical protein
MRVSTTTVLAAVLSAAILTAFGGVNNGLLLLSPMSVAPQVSAPRSVYTSLYSFNDAAGQKRRHFPPRRRHRLRTAPRS